MCLVLALVRPNRFLPFLVHLTSQSEFLTAISPKEIPPLFCLIPASATKLKLKTWYSGLWHLLSSIFFKDQEPSRLKYEVFSLVKQHVHSTRTFAIVASCTWRPCARKSFMRRKALTKLTYQYIRNTQTSPTRSTYGISYFTSEVG